MVVGVRERKLVREDKNTRSQEDKKERNIVIEYWMKYLESNGKEKVHMFIVVESSIEFASSSSVLVIA